MNALAAGGAALSIAGKAREAIRKSSKAKKNITGVSKKVLHAAKVGRAGARLAKKLTAGAPKTIYNAARGKGLVLSGSKYIGPGNPLNRGKPRGRADAAALQHDKDYDNYIAKGHKAKDVYLGFSDADKRLMKRSDTTTSAGLATYLGMKGKKILNKTGLTKRIRDSDPSPKPSTPPKRVKRPDPATNPPPPPKRVKRPDPATNPPPLPKRAIPRSIK